LTSQSGSIVSPNYPMGHGISMECVWTISVNEGSLIQVSFVDLDMQRRASECINDRVEVSCSSNVTKIPK